MARSFQKVIFCSLVLAACSSGAIMTRGDFDNVEIGTPVTEVVKQYGEPLKVRTYKNGVESYEYVERLPIGEQTVEENKYFFIIKNGKVAAKQYNYETPPAFDEIYDPDPNDVPN